MQVRRARQRDPRGDMLGFGQGLSPSLCEVGVDRLDVSVSGRWISSRSLTEFFSNRLQLVENGWLNTPVEREGSLTVELSQLPARNSSTLSAWKLRVTGRAGAGGIIRVKIGANPTRTLHHLLITLGSVEESTLPEWLDMLRELGPLDFFSKGELPNGSGQSLDGSDNFIPDGALGRGVVQIGFWRSYLGIFCDQLRGLCDLILRDDGATPQEGLRSDERLEVDWAHVLVPQIECYFERYHRSAEWAVRQGCWHLLAADHSATIHTYAGNWSAARDNRRFAATLPLRRGNWLAIYAKLSDRMRFERRRHGRGSYAHLPSHGESSARLMAILELERQTLIDRIRWETIGEIFSGPDEVSVPDFLLLVEQVEAASQGSAATMGHLLRSLIFDGAVVVPQTDAPPDLGRAVRDLQARGVIDRARVRPRDMNGRETRFALRAPFREIHSLFVEPLLHEPEPD